MRQGFYVFFSTSTTVPFDLVAYKDGKFWRVEVRSLSFATPTSPCFGWPGPKQEWDLLIVVSDDGICFQFVREPASNYSDCIDSIRRDLDLPRVVRPPVQIQG